MQTFVLDVPKELIADRLTDGPGKFCAMGVLLREVLELELIHCEDNGWGFRGDAHPLGVKLGIDNLWWDLTVLQNNSLTNPRSRVNNFKRRLRALESYGHVQFLFLDEPRDTQKSHGLEALMADTFGATTDAQRCDVVDVI